MQRKRRVKYKDTWLYANPKHIDEIKHIWDMETREAAPTSAIKSKKDSEGDLQDLGPEDAEKHRRSVGML